MSQKSIECLIGRLATGEDLRRRFAVDAASVLRSFQAEGFELSRVETTALLRLEPEVLDRFARALDPRLQKASLDLGALPRRQRS